MRKDEEGQIRRYFCPCFLCKQKRAEDSHSPPHQLLLLIRGRRSLANPRQWKCIKYTPADERSAEHPPGLQPDSAALPPQVGRETSAGQG